MKLNIIIIVRMPGKTRAALNQFFARLHEDEEEKFSGNNCGFFEKANDLWFLSFYV